MVSSKMTKWLFRKMFTIQIRAEGDYLHWFETDDAWKSEEKAQDASILELKAAFLALLFLFFHLALPFQDNKYGFFDIALKTSEFRILK